MPRRRFITKGRLTASVLIAAIILILLVSLSTPEAFYQGHSASYWLREILYAGQRQSQALEAFNKMGADADPVLVAALGQKENPFVRLYRGLWNRLPAGMERHLPKPDEPNLSQMAAVVVFQRAASTRAIPNLYPMLKEPDSGVRQAVLNAMKERIPNRDQIPLLVLAGNDPDPTVRRDVWNRLSQIGPAATNAVPVVLQLCADQNIDVRQDAAWALWQITRQTNTAALVLEGAVSQDPIAVHRHLAAYHLLVMGDSSRQFITALVDSLTNSQAGDRATVCTFLGQIIPPAVTAVPALRKTLQDPEPEVRRCAEVALSRIDPEHAATNSP